ncbi:transmembrane protein [Legionella birminghamensis]|uniref:Transmembrane protein n=1 Tax=Legionella birminghamensis TaxID=28083 RepID=A0A378IAQ5_9GAMM|nr:DNA recombination protein RmuC [Legionella birminghamensis]KTC76107.1 transmembrane protein [Legionella birminghamensis]STX32269.1 transmembrane protein [Legionella birminghamensis]
MPDFSFFFSLQGLVFINLLQLLLLLLSMGKNGKLQKHFTNEVTQLRELVIEQSHQLEMDISENFLHSQQRIYEIIMQNQLSAQELISKTIQQQMADIREQIHFSFGQHAQSLTSHLHTLTEEIRNHLQQLTQQVNLKLTEGFEKTSTTFTDVVRRLTIIDEAQKKITELSTHVVSLQDVLQDKRSRGAFGEVQLNTLIANMLPATHYQMQYTLSNQKRADCVLFLPEPTGQVAIDSKFPLETYQKLINSNCSPGDKKLLQQQFRQDVNKHIKDIAEKYIIPGETSDGAMMFIPAEAIFAEIHASYPELVALSQRLKVWLVSPSTLMAVLTTAKAVLKDDATRKQVHIIQKHLHALADDFQRFEKRMDKLSKHIDQAHQDVDEVSTSAKKITQRFQKIESVDLLLGQESD